MCRLFRLDRLSITNPFSRFPVLQFGLAFSSPALSSPAFWCRVFQFRDFQSRLFSSPVAASEQGSKPLRGCTLTVDSPEPLDTDPSFPALSASLDGAEIGAERAENRVSGSGVVSGGYRNRYVR